jgi:UDP-N-acetylglucosamine 3-dehydrogenase
VSAKRLAVVGAGVMGSNHIRVLQGIDGVELCAVSDNAKADALRSSPHNSVPSVYADATEMLAKERLDAVVIASPTPTHRPLALAALERGLAVLVEKPMASTEAECQEIIDAAEREGRPVMVGHIERYNPVVAKLKSFLDEGFLGDVYYLETVRSGPFPKRLFGSKDGVVIDLAVHDLDLVSFLAGELEQLYSHQIRIGDRRQDAYARVMHKTRKGILGSSEFSWISPRKERRITVFGDKGILLANMLDQELWYYENGDVELDYSDNYFQNVLLGRVSEGRVIKFPMRKEEPLRKELDAFLGLVGGAGGTHDASYGRRAVAYCLAVLRSGERDEIIRF